MALHDQAAVANSHCSLDLNPVFRGPTMELDLGMSSFVLAMARCSENSQMGWSRAPEYQMDLQSLNATTFFSRYCSYRFWGCCFGVILVYY